MAYVIGEDCISCGTCAGECPVEAISEGADQPALNNIGHTKKQRCFDMKHLFLFIHFMVLTLFNVESTACANILLYICSQMINWFIQ